MKGKKRNKKGEERGKKGKRKKGKDEGKGPYRSPQHVNPALEVAPQSYLP